MTVIVYIYIGAIKFVFQFQPMLPNLVTLPLVIVNGSFRCLDQLDVVRTYNHFLKLFNDK